jgi:hypothetical protein
MVLCYENIDLVVLFMITFNYKFDCSFCWYWWNWSTSLFKIFFFINHLLSIYKPGSWCFWPRNLCSNEQHKFLSISVSLRLLTFRLFQPWFPKDLLTHLIWQCGILYLFIWLVDIKTLFTLSFYVLVYWMVHCFFLFIKIDHNSSLSIINLNPWFPKDLLTHLIFPEIKTLKL